MGYEVFEHTADLGLRVRAADLPRLLEQAAEGLFAVLVANLDQVRPVTEHSWQVPGNPQEPEYLLFDWLSELLFTFESDRLLFSRFSVAVQSSGLAATGQGEPMDPARHQMDHEVKAITYHGLKVEQTAEGQWLAEVILDI